MHMGVMPGAIVVLAMVLVMILQGLILVLGLAPVDSMVLGLAMVALVAVVLLVVTIHMEDRKSPVLLFAREASRRSILDVCSRDHLHLKDPLKFNMLSFLY